MPRDILFNEMMGILFLVIVMLTPVIYWILSRRSFCQRRGDSHPSSPQTFC